MKRYDLIGNTPIIKINYLYNNEERHLYAKLEQYNITGSIKDRLVYYIMEKENLPENSVIVTATSGNTGISLASYGAKNNYEVHIFMPDFVTNERKELLKLYGAKLHLVSKNDGGFKACNKKAQEFARKNKAYLFDQFNDFNNIKCHYNTTGTEIVNSLNYVNKFVSGVGTGGTLLGVGERLKNKFGSEIIAIEPDTLPILSNKNATGSHKIDGIGDDFIPSIVDINKIDKIIKVNDEDAINMSYKLSKCLGLGVGISSGANFIGCALVSSKNDEVVTIFADDNKKYLSVKLDDKDKENFVSNKIKLVNYEVIN